MRYVVVREIEGTHRDSLVFPALEDARDYDGQVAYVCMEQPDDTPGGDPGIVTNCWLYEVDETDIERAREAALNEPATLFAVCFSPEES